MGTDELGRDDLARIIHGAQVSIEVGVVAVGVALVLGLLIGVTAAFYGGVIDAVLMRVVDILFAIPSLVLAILIAGLLGPSRTNAMIAIGIVFAPSFARVIRGSALTVLAHPYVEAARALGVTDLRIITRHVLRNIISPIIVLTTIYLSSRSSPRPRSASSALASSRRSRHGARCCLRPCRTCRSRPGWPSFPAWPS